MVVGMTGRPGSHVLVSASAKRRLSDIREGMESALGRGVSYTEVIEALLREHDQHVTEEAGA